MDKVYSLNTHPISGKPMKPAEHTRMMSVILGIVIAIGAIIGIWYWLVVSQTPPASNMYEGPSAQDQLRLQVASLLRSEATQPSQAEIDSVTAQLMKSKVSVTDSQRKMVATELEQ